MKQIIKKLEDLLEEIPDDAACTPDTIELELDGKYQKYTSGKSWILWFLELAKNLK